MMFALRRLCSTNKSIERDISRLENKLQEAEALFNSIEVPAGASQNPVHASEELERALYQLFRMQNKIKHKRGINKESPHFQRIKSIKWKGCSMQMGGDIDVETLLRPENRNFRRFVKSNKVHQCLINRNIKFSKVGDEPGVLFEGRAVAFNRLNEEAGRTVVNENNRLEGACITQQGIINHWPYRPSEFRPLEINAAPREDQPQYQIEVVTAMEKNKGQVGKKGHAFLRIHTPTGEVFSLGLCGNLDFKKVFSSLSHKNEACFDNYDRFENVSRLNVDMKGTKFECTEEQAQRAFEILREISTREIAPFNLFNNNCTGPVDRILKEVLEIDVPMDSPLRTFLGNIFFSDKMITSYRKRTPRWIKSCIRPVLNLFINLGTIIMGINRKDEACKNIALPQKVKFNTRDMIMKDPYLVRVWQEQIERDRQNEIPAEPSEPPLPEIVEQ